MAFAQFNAMHILLQVEKASWLISLRETKPFNDCVRKKFRNGLVVEPINFKIIYFSKSPVLEYGAAKGPYFTGRSIFFRIPLSPPIFFPKLQTPHRLVNSTLELVWEKNWPVGETGVSRSLVGSKNFSRKLKFSRL